MTNIDKKITAGMILLILLCFLQFTRTSAASVSVSASPSTLTSAGQVSLTFTVKNDSEDIVSDIHISGNGINYDAGEVVLDSGESKSFHLNLDVSESMLNKSLSFTVSYLENGENHSSTVSVTINKPKEPEKENPNLSVTRTADSSKAASGSKVKFTYTLKNTGNTKITDITVVDRDVNGRTPIGGSFSLEAGETRVLEWSVTIGTNSINSAPVVTFRASGKQHTVSLKALTVYVVRPDINFQITKSNATPDGTTFTLIIKNDGNQAMSNLVIYDENGKRITDSFSLGIGALKKIVYTVVPTEKRNVVFTIKGKDAAGGAYEESTKEYSVYPYIDPSLLGLSLNVTPLSQLSSNGEMKVLFTLENTGSVELTNITLKEDGIEEVIEEIDSLAIGRTDFEEVLQIGEPRKLVFTLSFRDPTGQPHTYMTMLTANTVNDIGGLSASAIQLTGGTFVAPITDVLVVIFYILLAITVVTGILLVALSVAEKKNPATKKRTYASAYNAYSGRSDRGNTGNNTARYKKVTVHNNGDDRMNGQTVRIQRPYSQRTEERHSAVQHERQYSDTMKYRRTSTNAPTHTDVQSHTTRVSRVNINKENIHNDRNQQTRRITKQPSQQPANKISGDTRRIPVIRDNQPVRTAQPHQSQNSNAPTRRSTNGYGTGYGRRSSSSKSGYSDSED